METNLHMALEAEIGRMEEDLREQKPDGSAAQAAFLAQAAEYQRQLAQVSGLAPAEGQTPHGPC